MILRLPPVWIALTCFWAAVLSSKGQVESGNTNLTTYQASQKTLLQSFSTLMASGATPQQIQAWQQQNAALIATQQQRASDLGAQSALEPLPLVPAPNIPAGASSKLKDFLTTQVILANARAQIHNQLLSALPADVTADQINQMQQSEQQQFQQQQAGNLQFQSQRAQTLAAEAATQIVPLPPALTLPEGISPQLAAFLTAKDKLVRAQITFSNQYVTATSAVRDAAMQQWMQQNAGSFQQLQQLAQNLSQLTTTQN